MLGPALGWLASARQCFDDPYGTLTRGLLTSAFALVIGLERVFHLDPMADAGFARLTSVQHVWCLERSDEMTKMP
jgi:hypothetical protein